MVRKSVDPVQTRPRWLLDVSRSSVDAEPEARVRLIKLATEVTDVIMPDDQMPGRVMPGEELLVGWRERVKKGYQYVTAMKTVVDDETQLANLDFQQNWTMVLESTLAYAMRFTREQVKSGYPDGNPEAAALGQVMNYNMVKFFVELGEKYGIVNELSNMFDEMVVGSKLGELMAEKLMEPIVRGWAGGVLGYFETKRAFPGCRLEVARPELDRLGVDLVITDPDGQIYYNQVKSGPRLKTKVENLAQEPDRQRFLADVSGQPRMVKAARTLFYVCGQHNAIPVFTQIFVPMVEERI